MASPPPPGPQLAAGSCIALFSGQSWGVAFMDLDQQPVMQCIVGRMIPRDASSAHACVAHFRPLGSQGPWWEGHSSYILHRHRCFASPALVPRAGLRRPRPGWAFCALDEAEVPWPVRLPMPLPAPQSSSGPLPAPPPSLHAPSPSSAPHPPPAPCLPALRPLPALLLAPPVSPLPPPWQPAATGSCFNANAQPLAGPPPPAVAAATLLAGCPPHSLTAGSCIAVVAKQRGSMEMWQCFVEGTPHHDAAAGTCVAVFSHYRRMGADACAYESTPGTVTLRYDQWSACPAAIPHARGTGGSRLLDWAFYDALYAAELAPRPAAGPPPAPATDDVDAFLAQQDEDDASFLQQQVVLEHRQQQHFQQRLRALQGCLPPPPVRQLATNAACAPPAAPPATRASSPPGGTAAPAWLGELPQDLWELMSLLGPPDTAARLSLTCRAMATVYYDPKAGAHALAHSPFSSKHGLLAPFAARPDGLVTVLRLALPALLATPFHLSRKLLRDVLCAAATAGLSALVTDLLDTVFTSPTDVSAHNTEASGGRASSDDCALETAVRANQVGTLTLLLDRSGSSVLTTADDGFGLFALAVHGCAPAAAPAVLDLLFARCPPAFFAEAEACALLWAVRADKPALLAALLPPAADCNEVERSAAAPAGARRRSVRARCMEEAVLYGHTAALAACVRHFWPSEGTLVRLVWLAARGWHAACLRSLLDKWRPINVDAHVFGGVSPLHAALQGSGPLSALDAVVGMLLGVHARVTEETLCLVDQWRGRWWGEEEEEAGRLRERLVGLCAKRRRAL